MSSDNNSTTVAANPATTSQPMRRQASVWLKIIVVALTSVLAIEGIYLYTDHAIDKKTKLLRDQIAEQESRIAALAKKLSVDLTHLEKKLGENQRNDKQVATLKEAVEDLTRRTVSPTALEATKKEILTEINEVVNEKTKMLPICISDVMKLSSYITEQIYPVIATSQTRLQDLEKRAATFGPVPPLQTPNPPRTLPTGKVVDRVLLEQSPAATVNQPVTSTTSTEPNPHQPVIVVDAPRHP